ncbi:hypothetical protein SASPL_102139 [Salvia splendens]|uniref:Small nuclear ribonucleoprotein G n=1 Tax=Salvia splendens TaxID=180675 RepID=A0A8X8YVD6_SALSN|nr:hypothetical protein SASPL_102139 [Salvia splendens]
MSRSGQPPDLKKQAFHYFISKSSLFARMKPTDLSLFFVLISVVKLNANCMVVGTLRGFDQFMNLVVDNTVEVNGNEKSDIGMVVIRGNSVVTVEALEPVSRAQ